MPIDEERALSLRWQARQDQLQALLERQGAAHHDWRADLLQGRFWWQHPETGVPEVVASAKVLCSYALSNRSLLAGWANGSLPPGAAIEPVPGVPDHVAEADEGEAWTYALRLADGAKAHHVYRAPNPQSWVFLGLWDVRPASPGDEPFAARPPWEFVRDVLQELLQGGDPREQATLMRNYARTFIERPVDQGTPWQKDVQAAGRRLAELADLPAEEQADGLRALLREVQARL